MIDYIYRMSPNFLQNTLVTVFNFFAYRIRYGGRYEEYLQLFNSNVNNSLEVLKNIQKERYEKLVIEAIENSLFYRCLYEEIDSPESIENLKKLPIVNKESLRKNIDKVYTINKADGVVSKTGGTTGKSLEVYYTKKDVQERMALTDCFRGKYGYKLGKKTAWFSGKSLLNNKDLKQNRFWKTDFLNKVRYYSTFHINESNLEYYLNDLLTFKPEYLVGFPSNMLEIAKFGLKNEVQFPEGTIKAIFPTAESMTTLSRKIIEEFFNSKAYDQYASSEGAPFIFECCKGNLHLELQSGLFEVLDDAGNDTKKGRLIVTSFTTQGTPLIRYDIGDSIELSDLTACTCGNNNPQVNQILGRGDDYIYSKCTGKINLGNISNTLKDTSGIVKFQVMQNELDSITIFLVIDSNIYSQKVEEKFIKNWRERIGNKMDIKLDFVNDIPVESSGKYRMVKNSIKHLH